MQTWEMMYKGDPLHLSKMMKPKVIELKACIWSQIQNYEELPQLITSLWASHARVFRSMDVIVRTHTIPSIDTFTEENSKKQFRLELDMYFDYLMHATTSTYLEIGIDTMHQYVVGSVELKTMMCMLSDELDRGAKSVYLDVTEARVFFQQDVTIEHADTITDYQVWHDFTTVDHRENIEELVFSQFPSLNDILHGLLKPILSHMDTCADCNVTSCKSERPKVDSIM